MVLFLSGWFRRFGPVSAFARADQRERDGDRSDRDGSAGQDAAEDRTAVVRPPGAALEADGTDAEFSGEFGAGLVRDAGFVVDAVFDEDGESLFFCVHLEGSLSWLLWDVPAGTYDSFPA